MDEKRVEANRSEAYRQRKMLPKMVAVESEWQNQKAKQG
jgi:hypothetical protein